MLISLALFAAAPIASAPIASAPGEPITAECTFEREAVLATDFVPFDQTEGEGWRPLYDAGCYIEAANILRDWQARNLSQLSPDSPRERHFRRTLAWHEAQMWAFGGRNDVALPIFERTYGGSENASDIAHNRYVDGTIAFLKRDRDGLDTAIAALAATPKPSGWNKAVGADGAPIYMTWPLNLDVLQGLRRCWDEPYKTAYLCREIRKPR
ncbi:MAG: hypothetical protein MK010_02805 [Erythrobacter sp.]|nr:hypothetical protein [Erythrobacter sp.]